MITAPKDMRFDRDGTARGDECAAYVREWYEANRETWWSRHFGFGGGRGPWADDFMLRLIQRVDEVRRAELAALAPAATVPGDER